MNLHQFIEANALDFELEYIEFKDNRHTYKATIFNGKKRMTTSYFTGSGWNKDPELYDILDALRMESDCASSSFKEFCDNLGYSDDSISALKIYKACCALNRKLRKLLGDKYQAFVDCNEDVEF